MKKTNGVSDMHSTDYPPDPKDPNDKSNTVSSTKLAVRDRRDKELLPPKPQQQQEHIEFASSSSFSNQNSEEFNPLAAAPIAHGGGHIELRSSSSLSNYHNSAEFKPSRSYNHGHIEFGSSSSFSNHNSIELKPTKQREKTRYGDGDDSPARSSTSSDRNNLSPTRDKDPAPVKLPGKAPTVVGRPVKEEAAAPPPKKAEAVAGTVEVGGGGGSSQRKGRPSLSILRRTRRDQMVKRMGFAFRVFGALFSLVSFTVLAMDRNKGWALDSFDRYKEFRYCMVVNVMGFVYSVAQALHLGYQLVTGKSTAMEHLRHYLDFTVDQMVTYLLVSASSSAATRIDDWKSNWGDDKFPDMATAAVSMSFLAFVALATSSLISGYALCTFKSV